MLQYQCTMSLDGFIAGRGGDMSWLARHLGPDPAVDEVMRRTGALLVGGRTFRGDDPHKGTAAEGKAYGGGWSGPQFVLTRTPPGDPVPGVTFVDDLDRAVALAGAAAGDRNVGVLGAEVARRCLDAGLLEEIFVCVAPVLLGDGVRLFDRPGGPAVGLERLRGTTTLRMRVAR